MKWDFCCLLHRSPLLNYPFVVHVIHVEDELQFASGQKGVPLGQHEGRSIEDCREDSEWRFRCKHLDYHLDSGSILYDTADRESMSRIGHLAGGNQHDILVEVNLRYSLCD